MSNLHLSAHFFGHLINTIITTAGTLAVAWFALTGDAQSNETAQLQAFLARISDLEAQVSVVQSQVVRLSRENAKLTAENTQLTVRIGLLKSQVNYGEGSHAEAIFELIESLKTPAWCKSWIGVDDHPHFEMAYINSHYEFTYNVSKAKYIGSTDFDVHPVKIAEAFSENDLQVYKNRGWLDFSEVVQLQDGTKAPRRFWKFYHRVNNGPELVCGWEVP